jgi:hypothetical protein
VGGPYENEEAAIEAASNGKGWWEPASAVLEPAGNVLGSG